MKTIVVADQELTCVSCAECAVLFAMATRLHRKVHQDGSTFFCPSGHRNVYKPSRAEQLEQELAGARTAVQRTRETWQGVADAARERADRAERSNAALRGANTKLRRRLEGGPAGESPEVSGA